MNSGASTTLHISTQSGDVRVRVADVAFARVVDGQATIGDDGVVQASPSKRLEIHCPAGTNVVIGTKSGSVECLGPMGNVCVSSNSGKVHIEQAVAADVRSQSGKVDVGICAGACRVVTASGRVEIDTAADTHVTTKSGNVDVGDTEDARVRVASGKVRVSARGGGTVDVHCMSGRVEVDVPHGRVPAMRTQTMSGKVHTPDADGSSANGTVTVKTLSAPITVTER